MNPRLVLPAYLALCLVLGGASAAGIESNMLLQLLALGILAAALVTEHHPPLTSAGRQLLALLVLALALAVLQLVPLPPALWTSLPGRAGIVEGYGLLGQPLPWLPVSLAPHHTIASLLWLLPAIAILVGMLRLGPVRLHWIAWTVAGVTMASVAIGALQSAGGEGSDWYFYAITNVGVGTGFFANANHLATLLVATIPFLAALYLDARAGRSRQRASAMSMLTGGALAVVFVGLAVNRSLAGIGLAVPVLAASGLMILSRRRALPRWTAAAVALLLAGSVAVAFSAPFGNNLTGEEARVSQSSRYTSFTRSLAAAADHAPVGTGLGSFRQIYQRYEDPASVTPTYMNHVHSDLIELWLETGVAGLLLILLFLGWWARRTLAIWKDDEPNPFARAATIATAAMLAHSLVDYPLRTAALSALFAACCAIMAEPRARTKRATAGGEPSEARHLRAD